MLGDPGDQREAPVEAGEHPVGVPAVRAGVVRDLVVGHQVRVDAGTAASMSPITAATTTSRSTTVAKARIIG